MTSSKEYDKQSNTYTYKTIFKKKVWGHDARQWTAWLAKVWKSESKRVL